MEKYRISGNRDMVILNAEINKLAEEGFRPVMIQTGCMSRRMMTSNQKRWAAHCKFL